jgi:hypothetical protein
VSPSSADALAATTADPAAVAWVSGLVRSRLRSRRSVLSARQAATSICPDAALRIRLDATASTRAKRKQIQLAAAGLRPHWVDDEMLLGLTRNVDLVIDTTTLSIDGLKRKVFDEVESRLGWRAIPVDEPSARSSGLVLVSGLA